MSVISQIAQRAASFADQGVGLIADAIEERRENPLRQAMFHERMAAMLAAKPRRVTDPNGVRLRDVRVRYHERLGRRWRAKAEAAKASGECAAQPDALDELLDAALEAAPDLIEAAAERDAGKARDVGERALDRILDKPKKR